MLQNNSEEMKTIVETFIIEETEELIHDNEALDRWNELVDKLGLEGQTKIVSGDKSPIPFMHMKQSIINTFKCLCPREVIVKEYDATPIPVEILDLVALSVNEDYFNKIEIWYDHETPDPVCVGMTGYYYQTTWSSNRNTELDGKEFKTKQECIDAGATADVYFSIKNHYLIGRWADVKRSFKELAKMAKERYIRENGNRYRAEIKEAQRRLDDLEIRATEKFF